jgi:hypothetical protein
MWLLQSDLHALPQRQSLAARRVSLLTTILLSRPAQRRWHALTVLWHVPCNVLPQTVF